MCLCIGWWRRYNVGRTIVFPGGNNHAAAFAYFESRGCQLPTPAESAAAYEKCCREHHCIFPSQKLQCRMQQAAGDENAMAACAAAEGYESVQFTPEPDQPIVETFGHVSWLELLILIVDT